MIDYDAERERLAAVRKLRNEFERVMSRMSHIILELHTLGCDAALAYEQSGPNHGVISLALNAHPTADGVH